MDAYIIFKWVFGSEEQGTNTRMEHYVRVWRRMGSVMQHKYKTCLNKVFWGISVMLSLVRDFLRELRLHR